MILSGLGQTGIAALFGLGAESPGRTRHQEFSLCDCMTAMKAVFEDTLMLGKKLGFLFRLPWFTTEGEGGY